MSEFDINKETDSVVIEYFTDPTSREELAKKNKYNTLAGYQSRIGSHRVQKIELPKTKEELDIMYQEADNHMVLVSRRCAISTNRFRKVINDLVLDTESIRHMYEDLDMTEEEIAATLPEYITATNIHGFKARHKMSHSNKTGKTRVRRRKSWTAESAKKQLESRRKTNLAKYGVENTLQLPQVAKAREKALKAKGKNVYNEDIEHNPEDTKVNGIASAIFNYLFKEGYDEAVKDYMDYYNIKKTDSKYTMKEKVKSVNREKYGDNWFEQKALNPYTGIYSIVGVKSLVRDYSSENFPSVQVAYSYLNKPEKLIPLLGEEDKLHKGKLDYKYRVTTKWLSDFLGINYYTIEKHVIKLHEHGIISMAKSHPEDEVGTFIKSLNFEVRSNTRTVLGNGQELDLYIPAANLAIEYNGFYWHSSKFKSQTYHADKTTLSRSLGIKLFHIWEQDWLNPVKQEIIKSQLRYILHVPIKKYYARKLTIRKVTNEQAKEFLSTNHIQGANGIGNTSLGLYDKSGELVSVMNFGKRLKTDYEWELIRFASKLNSVVVGGASKLFKHFVNQYKPKSVESFANNDFAYSHASGKSVYDILGFEYTHTARPSYEWVHQIRTGERRIITLSRYKVQPKKLVSFTEGKSSAPFEWATPDFRVENSNETEAEYMDRHGWFKVWNAGRDLYVYNNN